MYGRILVPLDGGPVALAGLDEAIRVAQRCGATLRVIHVLEPSQYANGYETAQAYFEQVVPYMRGSACKLLEQAQQRAAARGVACETSLVETTVDAPADVVIEQAQSWPADLIVLGTHGRRGLNRLMLGSDAEQVARCAKVPVLLVRAPREPPANAG